MELKLMQGSCTVGFILCDAEQDHFSFTAVCEHPLDGIWRAYLTDETSDCLVGVMMPDQSGGFSARKRYSKTELRHLGICLEQSKGVLRFSRPIACTQLRWANCQCPGRLFRDSALQSAMQSAVGVLVDDEVIPTRVAVPLKSGCACAPALCLAQWMHYRGEDYAVLCVDHSGNPRKFSEQTENDSV